MITREELREKLTTLGEKLSDVEGAPRRRARGCAVYLPAQPTDHRPTIGPPTARPQPTHRPPPA